jgi:hypothetical protein
LYIDQFGCFLWDVIAYRDKKVVGVFVRFFIAPLHIKVALAYERTPDIKTSAYYDLDGFVKVYVKDRAVMDVCRSIAHELVHHKQNLENRISDINDGGDGSEIENKKQMLRWCYNKKMG